MKEAEGNGLGEPPDPESSWDHGADDAGHDKEFYRTVHTLQCFTECRLKFGWEGNNDTVTYLNFSKASGL